MFVTDSGLRYGEIVEGTGKLPKRGDTCVVHYTGWIKDGPIFDSSVDRSEPLTFQYLIMGLIPAWDETLATMKAGGKRLIEVPPQLGYGDQARDKIPAHSTLVFEMELLEVR